MTTTPWLPTLLVATPQAGCELAVKLSPMAVKLTQPPDDIRRELRKVYERHANARATSSHVVAVHIATIAAPNDHWRTPQG